MVMVDEILYIKTKQVYEVCMIDRYLEFQTFETPVPREWDSQSKALLNSLSQSDAHMCR